LEEAGSVSIGLASTDGDVTLYFKIFVLCASLYLNYMILHTTTLNFRQKYDKYLIFKPMIRGS